MAKRRPARTPCVPPRGRGLPTVAVALVASTLVLCVHASSAMAGVYKMYSCNVPGRNVSVMSASPWRALLDGRNTRAFDSCFAGGGFGLVLGPEQPFMARDTSAGFELRSPKPTIGIVGYRTWINADFTGATAFIEVGGAFSPPGGSTPDNAPWVSTPYPTTNPVVYVFLYCASGQDVCQFANTKPMVVRGIESDLYESALPSGSLVGGSLLSGQPQRGSRTVSFGASDEESGVAKIEFLLGTSVVAAEDLDADVANCPHVGWAACPQSHRGDLSVDTSSLAEGDYVGTLRVTDAAGNRRSIKHPDVIRISKAAAAVGGAGTGTGTGAGAGANPDSVVSEDAQNLTAQFAANAGDTYTTSFGRAARVRGRLKDAKSRPMSNASVVITERFDSGGRRTETVTTDTSGRYSYSASGRSPSRRIDVSHSASAASISARPLRKLRLLVRAASTLGVTLRGVQVTYQGRVMAQPLPRSGKKIYIQGRAKGGAWQRFASRRTDAAGRFTGRYRLRVRRPGVKLQFRVEIPSERGFPYVARTGSPVTRTVR